MRLIKDAPSLALLLFSCSRVVLSQAQSSQPPSSYPHVYPGQPTGDFSPEWQNYFLVKDPLPNVTFHLERSFAGNLPVQRVGHPNNTLFFVGFEKSEGSLTNPPNKDQNEPWGIWLNGGPGSSSMYGLFLENGPIQINSNYSASPNNYSWSGLADYFWIDQPVGVGYATADSNGYVHDEDEVAADFLGFLANLVKVFPNLQERPLIITGESYSGTYIPYIMKAYFNMTNPPVKVGKFVIGDGTTASGQVFELLPVLSIIETFPQLIGYDQQVFQYFEAQTHLCQYDVNLTYPQNGTLPTIPLVAPTQREIDGLASQFSSKTFLNELYRRGEEKVAELERHGEKTLAKRDSSDFLKNRPFDQLDPWYGCILLLMYVDYAVNYTFPYTLGNSAEFNVYDMADARIPPDMGDASVFLNDPRVRQALHAPTSKDWAMQFPFVFGDPNASDPSPEPMTFLTDLATNSTKQNISVVFYSGNNDGLIAHRGTEVTIQNTTFGGVQGFTRKPSTPWQDDSGNFAGIVHQERNWTYVLFSDSGHTVPRYKPEAAYVFLREFVVGQNQTGLVINTPSGVTVVGGENATLAEDVMPGTDGILYNPTPGATAVSTFVFPEATREAWTAFIRTETARPSVVQGGGRSAATNNAAVAAGKWLVGVWGMVLVGVISGYVLVL